MFVPNSKETYVIPVSPYYPVNVQEGLSSTATLLKVTVTLNIH